MISKNLVKRMSLSELEKLSSIIEEEIISRICNNSDCLDFDDGDLSYFFDKQKHSKSFNSYNGWGGPDPNDDY